MRCLVSPKAQTKRLLRRPIASCLSSTILTRTPITRSRPRRSSRKFLTLMVYFLIQRNAKTMTHMEESMWSRAAVLAAVVVEVSLQEGSVVAQTSATSTCRAPMRFLESSSEEETPSKASSTMMTTSSEEDSVPWAWDSIE